MATATQEIRREISKASIQSDGIIKDSSTAYQAQQLPEKNSDRSQDPADPEDNTQIRPPIEYSSFGAFWGSVGRFVHLFLVGYEQWVTSRVGASRVYGPAVSSFQFWLVYGYPCVFGIDAFQAGQLLSFCITSTSVITTKLTMRGFNLPTTQTWFLCVP